MSELELLGKSVFESCSQNDIEGALLSASKVIAFSMLKLGMSPDQNGNLSLSLKVQPSLSPDAAALIGNESE